MPLPLSRFVRLGIRASCAVILLISLRPSTARAQASEVPAAAAYNYGETETPRTAALGGASRAVAIGTDAILANPANMGLAKVYHIGAFAQLYPEAGRQAYGGAVVDSLISSSGIAGGFSVLWSQLDPEGIRREWLDMRFGLGLPLGDIVYLGMSGRYYNANQNGLGPLGFSEASGGIPDASIIQTITIDAGATLRPVPEFMISLVGHNLTNPDTSMLPLMGAIAIGFMTEDFTLSGDVVVESRTYEEARLRFQGGGEVLIADRVPLRAGYRFDQGLNAHSVSGGVGYLDKRFGVDVAVRRAFGDAEFTAITFGFTVHIEALGFGM